MLLFVAIAIILIVLMGLGYPLFRGGQEEAPVETYIDRRFRELRSRKESIYSTIKELDFDFRTDKLSEEDYKELGERYRGEALSLLKEIDEMDKGEDMETLIEKEILTRRTPSILREREGKGKSEDIEGIIEKEILTLRKSLPFCSHCGSGYGEKDEFCSHCGRKLK